MKVKILELREKGKTYNEIVAILGCSKGTVSYHCGNGQKAKAKSRNFINKESSAKLKRENRLQLQKLAFRYKRFCSCKICGIKNPVVLQFDHRDSSEKITTIAQMISDRYPLDIFKAEIRKCDVLCANCHLIKTARDFNYFSNKNAYIA